MGTGLIWFRNDLRIKDNEALVKACRTHENVIGIYFFDPRQYRRVSGFTRTGKFRAKFLIESISQLRKNLEALNISLLVYQQEPEHILPQLIGRFGISSIYFQKEWTRDEKMVESALKSLLPKVKFHSFYQQFLFHPHDLPYRSFSEVPRIFTEFRKTCEKQVRVRKPYEMPPARPKENILPEEFTQIPSLNDLGLEEFQQDARTAFPFCGGEDEAWKRIEEYFWESENLTNYKETRNGLLGKDYSSKLSAWLSNGGISPRQIFYEIKSYEEKIIRNQSTYWLIFELIWRDFFKYVSLKYGNAIFLTEGILNRKTAWKKDTELIEKWIEGETGQNFVNANMKELKQTGFMSNRGRQIVNSFLAKELQQDWRIGAWYFESLLIDYDVHSNWGNWMYNSGVGNDPRDRKFNIEHQARIYDPANEYQGVWLKD